MIINSLSRIIINVQLTLHKNPISTCPNAKTLVQRTITYYNR